MIFSRHGIYFGAASNFSDAGAGNLKVFSTENINSKSAELPSDGNKLGKSRINVASSLISWELFLLLLIRLDITQSLQLELPSDHLLHFL